MTEMATTLTAAGRRCLVATRVTRPRIATYGRSPARRRWRAPAADRRPEHADLIHGCRAPATCARESRPSRCQRHDRAAVRTSCAPCRSMRSSASSPATSAEMRSSSSTIGSGVPRADLEQIGHVRFAEAPRDMHDRAASSCVDTRCGTACGQRNARCDPPVGSAAGRARHCGRATARLRRGRRRCDRRPPAGDGRPADGRSIRAERLRTVGALEEAVGAPGPANARCDAVDSGRRRRGMRACSVDRSPCAHRHVSCQSQHPSDRSSPRCSVSCRCTSAQAGETITATARVTTRRRRRRHGSGERHRRSILDRRRTRRGPGGAQEGRHGRASASLLLT